jgi:hypothetical protein
MTLAPPFSTFLPLLHDKPGAIVEDGIVYK